MSKALTHGLAMAEHIHQSNLIEDIDSEAEDKQSLIAWHDLMSRATAEAPLSFNALLKAQKIITLHQTDLMPHQRGYTRSMSKVNVYVGTGPDAYVPPAWYRVDGLLENLVLDATSYANGPGLDPWLWHKRFEKIHPFVDGNGRTGRMAYWALQIARGQEPTLIPFAKRQDYYRSLDGGPVTWA